MSDYDIGKAFEKIENELIASMIRNLDRHRAEEKELGIEWSQWQAEQLKALEVYKRKNSKKFIPQYSTINQHISRALQDSYNDGGTKQERQILQAIKRGFKGEKKQTFTGVAETTGEFFKTNERKLNSLIEATTHDMEKAEIAVLRMANDQYRKIIFNAQVMANTGAGTYAKAVDMATKDFLSAGINCIEYKNGRRVNIKSYAEMALRTANKRAYLQGEGAKRQEWGIYTVILNKRGNPCPLCAPFVGRVFIDDVWSGGPKNGISPVTGVKYPLLSEAIKKGLYHPNCKDAHTTYFEGISTPPESSQYTADELDELAERYNNTQKQNCAQNEAERMERMSKFSLDKDNKRAYGARAEQWREKAHRISDPDIDNNLSESVINSEKSIEKAVKSDIIKYEYSPKVKESVREAFDAEFTAMSSKFGNISTISRVESLPKSYLKNVYGMFIDSSGSLMIHSADKKDCLSLLAQKAVEMKKAGKWSTSHPMHAIRHEIGHAIQYEHLVNDPLWNDKKKKIFAIMQSADKIAVSEYAMSDIDEFISECIAESMTKKSRKIARDVVNIVLGG